MTNGILKDKELDLWGGSSLYKTLSSTPPGNFTYHDFTASWTVLPSAAVEHPAARFSPCPGRVVLSECSKCPSVNSV